MLSKTGTNEAFIPVFGNNRDECPVLLSARGPSPSPSPSLLLDLAGLDGARRIKHDAGRLPVPRTPPESTAARASAVAVAGNSPPLPSRCPLAPPLPGPRLRRRRPLRRPCLSLPAPTLSSPGRVGTGYRGPVLDRSALHAPSSAGAGLHVRTGTGVHGPSLSPARPLLVAGPLPFSMRERSRERLERELEKKLKC